MDTVSHLRVGLLGDVVNAGLELSLIAGIHVGVGERRLRKLALRLNQLSLRPRRID